MGDYGKIRTRSSCKLGAVGLSTFEAESKSRTRKGKLIMRPKMTSSLERAYKRLQREVNDIDQAEKVRQA